MLSGKHSGAKKKEITAALILRTSARPMWSGTIRISTRRFARLPNEFTKKLDLRFPIFSALHKTLRVTWL
jgi:hypothetical protein